jgi:hypothetical protein
LIRGKRGKLVGGGTGLFAHGVNLFGDGIRHGLALLR